MKRVTMDSVVTLGGREYKINTNSSKRQGCFVEILRTIESKLTAMLSYHCKVFVVQFVVHCHGYEAKNEGVSRLMAVFKKRLARKYDCARVTGGWVREPGSTGIQHYHIAILLDGNKVRSRIGVQHLVNEILEARGYPRPSFNKSHMVFRGDEQSVQEAFYHLSYLAKTRSKSKRLPDTNDYFFGHLKPRNVGDILDL